ncbi:MAG: flavodoxin family protein [Erysipelotrichaceae bacterium]|nr:flavodoxin family protein [Erysipelotrichaceae bacterium]
MKKIVVYYSMSENVDYVARIIAEKTGADLLRLVPEKAYPDKGLKKFYWGGKAALMGEKPGLEPYVFDKDYDLIIFGSPVWASCFTPPIRTFIADNKEALKDKKFAAYVCCSGSGGQRALNKLKEELNIDGFTVEAIFIDPKDKKGSEEKIETFIKGL